jgi:hypothetical protein
LHILTLDTKIYFLFPGCRHWGSNSTNSASVSSVVTSDHLHMSRYYTAIDRALNKARRKGFIIYTTLVLAATLYTVYSVSHLPDVSELEELRQRRLKKLDDKANAKKKPKLKGNNDTPKATASLTPSVEHELSKDHNEIDNWSRKQLHSYLAAHKIYVDLDTTNKDLIEQVKAIFYEEKVAHFV